MIVRLVCLDESLYATAAIPFASFQFTLCKPDADGDSVRLWKTANLSSIYHRSNPAKPLQAIFASLI